MNDGKGILSRLHDRIDIGSVNIESHRFDFSDILNAAVVLNQCMESEKAFENCADNILFIRFKI